MRGIMKKVQMEGGVTSAIEQCGALSLGSAFGYQPISALCHQGSKFLVSAESTFPFNTTDLAHPHLNDQTIIQSIEEGAAVRTYLTHETQVSSLSRYRSRSYGNETMLTLPSRNNAPSKSNFDIIS